MTLTGKRNLSWIKIMTEKNLNQLKKFGLLVGGIFITLSLLALHKGKTTAFGVEVILGALLFIPALIRPQLLARPYAAWMKLAVILGAINATVLLSIIFFILLTPIGLIKKIFSNKKNDKFSFKTGEVSYWIKRGPVNQTENLKRQF